MKRIGLIDLGFIDFWDSWLLQVRLAGLRHSGRVGDLVLLAEHPPVISVGKRGGTDGIDVDIPVRKVGRGGLATYHGPGQILCYPIIGLDGLGLTVKDYVWMLEEVMIRAIEPFGLKGERMDGMPGVWIEGRKVGSIGLCLKGSVCYHGFALNVSCDLDYFRLISPCGIDGRLVTSMSQELGRRIDIGEVKPYLIDGFESVFGVKLEGIDIKDIDKSI